MNSLTISTNKEPEVFTYPNEQYKKFIFNIDSQSTVDNPLKLIEDLIELFNISPDDLVRISTNKDEMDDVDDLEIDLEWNFI